MATTYRIADEPIPGRLASLTVNPFWPLLSVMFAGFWLALPWFALNSAAMGSASRRREWTILAAGAALSAALGFALLLGIGSEHLSARAFKYLLIGLVAWRLGVAYLVYTLQAPSFELHQHFGGRVWNGAFLVIVLGAVFGPANLLGKEGAFLLALLVG